jgi:predicted nucleotidyltransferase
MLRPVERSLLSDASSLLRQRFPIAKVVLFGSKARGDAGPDSDLDVLVLTTRRLSDLERRQILSELYDLSLAAGAFLSPLVVPLDEWASGRASVLPIHREVERDGVLL